MTTPARLAAVETFVQDGAMANGQTLRPCSYCGGGEFIHLPSVALELKKPVSVFGAQGTQNVRPYPVVALLICSRCGRTEWFAQGVQQLAQQFPGAQSLRAG